MNKNRNEITYMQEGKPIASQMTEYTQRKVMQIDACVVAIYMLDSIIFSELERLVYKATCEAKERGLYRFGLKKRMNDMQRCITEKRRTRMGDGVGVFLELNYQLLPQARKRYIECGGNGDNYLSSVFRRTCGLLMDRMESECFWFSDTLQLKEKDMVAILSCIMALCGKTLEIHEYQTNAMHHMFTATENVCCLGGKLRQYVNMKIEGAKVNEPWIRCVKQHAEQMIEEVTKGTLCSENSKDQERLADAFNALRNELGGETMMKITERTFISLIMDYVEFAMACLRTDMDNAEGVGGGWRTTLSSLIGAQRVDELLDELRTVQPMTDEEDMFDLAGRIPTAKEGSALFALRMAMRRGLKCDRFDS